VPPRDLIFYPNPVTDYLHIKSESIDDLQEFEADLISINGSTMAHYPAPLPSSIDLRRYPSGLYFLRVTSGNTIEKTYMIIRI